MMQRRSIIIAAGLIAVVAFGLFATPLFGQAVANAQTSTPTSEKGSGLRSLFLDNLAATLNIQRSALDSAITSAAETTVGDAVQQGTLTQEQADALKSRIQSGNLGSILGGRGGSRGERGQIAGLRQAMIDAAAKTLNLTSDELKTQLRSGKTLAELAQTAGTTEQAVVDAALAAAKTTLDSAVSSGTLTQAQADAIYTRLEKAGAKILSQPGAGSQDHRGRGNRNAPSTTPTPTAGA